MPGRAGLGREDLCTPAHSLPSDLSVGELMRIRCALPHSPFTRHVPKCSLYLPGGVCVLIFQVQDFFFVAMLICVVFFFK